eukprot:210641-Pleurochrysis_carterae.AAC.1
MFNQNSLQQVHVVSINHIHFETHLQPNSVSEDGAGAIEAEFCRGEKVVGIALKFFDFGVGL